MFVVVRPAYWFPLDIVLRERLFYELFGLSLWIVYCDIWHIFDSSVADLTGGLSATVELNGWLKNSRWSPGVRSSAGHLCLLRDDFNLSGYSFNRFVSSTNPTWVSWFPPPSHITYVAGNSHPLLPDLTNLPSSRFLYHIADRRFIRASHRGWWSEIRNTDRVSVQELIRKRGNSCLIVRTLTGQAHAKPAFQKLHRCV